MICNNYASSKGYKLESKFTSSQPSKTAVFLGTKTEVQSDGTLSTDLFCKSMAFFQYLQHDFTIHHMRLHLFRNQSS